MNFPVRQYSAPARNCVSAVNNQCLPDVQAALYCYSQWRRYRSPMPKPSLSIVRAAVGMPAVAAKEAVADTATTPAIAADAAVTAQMPGVILIFPEIQGFYLDRRSNAGTGPRQPW
jgi:hypothetical protein